MLNAYEGIRLLYSTSILQSAAKSFEHLQEYLQFFSSLVANLYHLMLLINRIMSIDNNLTNIYFIQLQNVRFLRHELSKMFEKFCGRLYIFFFILYTRKDNSLEIYVKYLYYLCNTTECINLTKTEVHSLKRCISKRLTSTICRYYSNNGF